MKKGFTLIEMLGIISVLAIVLIVTFPILNTALKDMKEDKNASFVETIGISVETYVGLYDITEPTTITIQDLYDLDLLKGNYSSLNANYKDTSISINQDGEMTIELRLGDKCYIKTPENDDVVIEPLSLGSCDTFGGTYVAKTANDTHRGIVYMNPANVSAICNSTSAISTPGTKTGCMKFYIIKDNGNGTVDMILDHNTTTSVKWSGATTNENGPREALYQLYEDTKDWSSIQSVPSSKNYTVSTTNQNYTINYTKHIARNGQAGSYTYTEVNGATKARLITTEEIATLAGKENWTLGSTNYYFGSLDTTVYQSQSGPQKARQTTYAWLFDYLSGCGDRGCTQNSTVSNNESYWTASPTTTTTNAWRITYDGGVDNDTISSTTYGIRPVITVNKNVYTN